MTMRELWDGLNILLKYGNGHVSADHDVIYVDPGPSDSYSISEPDSKRLDELDWMWDEPLECWRHYC